jgi:hypothetical protein
VAGVSRVGGAFRVEGGPSAGGATQPTGVSVGSFRPARARARASAVLISSSSSPGLPVVAGAVGAADVGPAITTTGAASAADAAAGAPSWRAGASNQLPSGAPVGDTGRAAPPTAPAGADMGAAEAGADMGAAEAGVDIGPAEAGVDIGPAEAGAAGTADIGAA